MQCPTMFHHVPPDVFFQHRYSSSLLLPQSQPQQSDAKRAHIIHERVKCLCLFYILYCVASKKHISVKQKQIYK